MNRLTSFLLIAFAGITSMQAQVMTVVRTDGQVRTIARTDIDSITFSVLDPLAASPAYTLLRIHTGSGISQFALASIDSITLGASGTMTVHHGPGSQTSYAVADVDSMTYAGSAARTITIVYNGTGVSVDNPLEGSGVAVVTAGADVTVTATGGGLDGVTYALSGAASDGMFKLYGDAPFTLALNGVSLTNADGPAINIQSKQTASVVLADSSTLTDGTTYAAAPNGEDQKGAFFSEGDMVFTGSGAMTVLGKGADQHGLCSDGGLTVGGGRIFVRGAVKDGLHTNDGFSQSGGRLEVMATSDAIDGGDGPVSITGGYLVASVANAGRDALKSGTGLVIGGGEVLLGVGGNGSKGLKAAHIELTGGTVTIQTTGGVVLEASGLGFDPSYCSAAKADDALVLDGSQVTITTTGIAGRGLSCDGDILVQSGGLTVTSSGGGGTYTNELGALDAYHGPCVNADGDIVVTGGTTVLTHSGSAGKGIAGDGKLTIGTAGSAPTLQVTTNGTKISLGSGEYAEAKAISVDSMITIINGTISVSSADDAIKSKYWIQVNGGEIAIPRSVEGLEAPNVVIAGGTIHLTSSDDGINATYGADIEGNDGSNLTVSGGYVHLNAPTGDGMDSNGNLTVSGGTIIVHGPPAQPEVGLDVNGTFLVTGGVMVVAQINSNMVEMPVTQSTQRSVLLRTSQAIAGGTLIHLEDTNGSTIVTFKPARNYSAVLVSTPALTAGTSYRVYTGGSSTGTLTDGLYTGGTYSPGTLKATFTSTSVAQTVTF